MAGKAYDLSGNENSEGYKWIGFEFGSNDISYDSGTATNYLNIYDKLNSYFNDDVINKVKDESNSDAIGIVNIGTKIGNLSVEFNSYSIWYDQGTVNVSLESILADSSYGSLHIVSSSGEQSNWGPVINNNDSNITESGGIFIFIGLKNSVSL